jgi:hypothetical protein
MNYTTFVDVRERSTRAMPAINRYTRTDHLQLPPKRPVQNRRKQGVEFGCRLRLIVHPDVGVVPGGFVRVRLEVRRLIAAPVLAVVGRSQVVTPTAPPCSGGLGRLPTGG